MTYCTSCGRASPDDVRFCAHCGIALSRPVLGYETPTPAIAPAPPVVPSRPVGRTQEPWLVLLLMLVTLGIYSLVWLWRISKEADAFAGQPGRAHGVMKAGVIVNVVSGIVVVVSLVAVVAAIFGAMTPEQLAAGEEFDAEALAPETLATMGFGGLLLLVGFLGSLVGSILTYVGLFRVWQTVEADERARGVPSPLSPGLMLILVLAPILSSFVSWIPILGGFISLAAFAAVVAAYWITQKRLNDTWAAAQPAWQAPPQQTYAP